MVSWVSFNPFEFNYKGAAVIFINSKCYNYSISRLPYSLTDARMRDICPTLLPFDVGHTALTGYNVFGLKEFVNLLSFMKE